jgi:hypothetical protein
LDSTTANSASAEAKTLLVPVAIGVVLIVGVGLVMWRAQSRKSTQTLSSTTSAAHPVRLVEAVKEELFQLEKEKVRGAISHEEYATAKKALDQAFERAMAKAAAQK